MTIVNRKSNAKSEIATKIASIIRVDGDFALVKVSDSQAQWVKIDPGIKGIKIIIP
jgi:hypothetical protein